jgi:hypothetical protein
MKFSFFLLVISILISPLKAMADFGNDICLYKAEITKEATKLPAKIDDITELKDITCAEGVPTKFQYQDEISTYINEDMKKSANSFMIKNVFPKLNQTWCTTPSFLQMIELFDIEFIYRDLGGNEFLRHRIMLKDCSTFIKK